MTTGPASSRNPDAATALRPLLAAGVNSNRKCAAIGKPIVGRCCGAGTLVDREGCVAHDRQRSVSRATAFRTLVMIADTEHVAHADAAADASAARTFRVRVENLPALRVRIER